MDGGGRVEWCLTLPSVLAYARDGVSTGADAAERERMSHQHLILPNGAGGRSCEDGAMCVSAGGGGGEGG